MGNNSYMMANSVNIENIPQVIKILPLGNVCSQKGDFIVDSSSYVTMNQRFLAHKVDIVVDYEHQTLENKEAPAGGWIKELILNNDGIYAQVEWTDKAKSYIKAKEYRYLSPVVLVNKNTGKAIALHSVALTNTPAIDGMSAIINSMNKGIDIVDQQTDELNDKNTDSQQQPKNTQLKMDVLTTIAKELGLKDNATLDEILSTVKQLISDKAETESISNKLKVEKANAENAELVQMALSIGQIEPSQTEWAYKRCAEDVDGFKFFVEGAYKKECDKVVGLALENGKIAPFQKEWAEQLALKDLEIFKTFVNQSLPVIPIGELQYLKDDTHSTSKHNSKNNRASELMGLTDEEVNKYDK